MQSIHFCWPRLRRPFPRGCLCSPPSHTRVSAIITLFQLLVPHFDNERRVLAVVDDPERQGLDALLRAAQLRQLLLQRRLGEGRHAADGARFSPPP